MSVMVITLAVTVLIMLLVVYGMTIEIAILAHATVLVIARAATRRVANRLMDRASECNYRLCCACGYCLKGVDDRNCPECGAICAADHNESTWREFERKWRGKSQ